MTIFYNLYSSPKLIVLIIQGHCPKIMLNINTKKTSDSVAHYISYIINIWLVTLTLMNYEIHELYTLIIMNYILWHSWIVYSDNHELYTLTLMNCILWDWWNIYLLELYTLRLMNCIPMWIVLKSVSCNQWQLNVCALKLLNMSCELFSQPLLHM